MDISEQLDIRRANIDMALFAAALALRHLRSLIANGGSEFGRPDLESALHPQVIEAFLDRAVTWAQQTRRFEQQWLRLQRGFPAMKRAWEKGQQLFQQHLTEAEENLESMGYLSQADFAVDCYAEVAAKQTYPALQAQQNWLINGYIVVWREQFLTDEEEDAN